MKLIPSEEQAGLWFDPNWKKETPGTFAIVIGVSHYTYLKDGQSPVSDGGESWIQEAKNLGQLQVSALTAFDIFRWLTQDYRFDSAPLPKCWLLLSPTKAECENSPKILDNLTPPTYQKCEEALGSWFSEMNTLPKQAKQLSRAFFFFSGHGLEMHQSQQILLPSDYLAPPIPNLNKAISTSNIKNGLPSLDIPYHLLLIDACRNDFKEIRGKKITGSSIFNEDESAAFKSREPSSTVILYATSSGLRAWQQLHPDQGRSLFGQALLDGLVGKAGIELKQLQDLWLVEFDNLHRFLIGRIVELLRNSNARAIQPVSHDISGRLPVSDLEITFLSNEMVQRFRTVTTGEFSIEQERKRLIVLSSERERAMSLKVKQKKMDFGYIGLLILLLVLGLLLFFLLPNFTSYLAIFLIEVKDLLLFVWHWVILIGTNPIGLLILFLIQLYIIIFVKEYIREWKEHRKYHLEIETADSPALVRAVVRSELSFELDPVAQAQEWVEASFKNQVSVPEDIAKGVWSKNFEVGHALFGSEDITTIWSNQIHLFAVNKRTWIKPDEVLILSEVWSTEDRQNYRVEFSIDYYDDAGIWIEVVDRSGRVYGAILPSDQRFKVNYIMEFDIASDERGGICRLDIYPSTNNEEPLEAVAALWTLYRNGGVSEIVASIEELVEEHLETYSSYNPAINQDRETDDLEQNVRDLLNTPLLFTVAAFVLLKANRFDLLNTWYSFVSNRFEDQPDIAVIQAELIQRQGAEESQAFIKALSYLTKLVELGVPRTAEGFSYAVNLSNSFNRIPDKIPDLDRAKIMQVNQHLDHALTYFHPGGLLATYSGFTPGSNPLEIIGLQ